MGKSLELLKKEIELFYLNIFNYPIDWDSISMPSEIGGMNYFEVVIPAISEKRIIDAYYHFFCEDRVFTDFCESQKFKLEQPRPVGNYAFFIKGEGYPSPDLSEETYEGAEKKGIKFLLPKEGLILAFHAMYEKKHEISGRYFTLDGTEQTEYPWHNDLGFSGTKKTPSLDESVSLSTFVSQVGYYSCGLHKIYLPKF
ncbi:MAG: hypothetical protein WCS86_01290 [Candidatus Paceibacterota bacterium]